MSQLFATVIVHNQIQSSCSFVYQTYKNCTKLFEICALHISSWYVVFVLY